MTSLIKSTLVFLALTSIATAQEYDTRIAPEDCKSTKSFYSCMATVTNWENCDHTADVCYCPDFDIEENCLSKYCSDTTETPDQAIFAECKTLEAAASTRSAKKPSNAKATPTSTKGNSEETQPTKADAGPTATGKPNSANLATAPVGSILGLVGVALGALIVPGHLRF